MKVLVIPPEGEVEVREIDGTLESFQGIVGGYIEPIRIAPGLAAYVDEDGHAKDSQLNTRATVMAREGGALSLIACGIVGTMVVFELGDDGKERDIPTYFVVSRFGKGVAGL